MEKINKSDTTLAAIRIHLAGVAFYRTAYEQNDNITTLAQYLEVLFDAIQQIDELVNGKPTS